MGFYPKRVSVAAKMSPYRYCKPQCQQAHWRLRQRQARLDAKPTVFCLHCGDRLPKEYRPGRPRRYCSPSHAEAAANKRRPSAQTPAVSSLEAAAKSAVEEAQAAWAVAEPAAAKATAARREVEAEHNSRQDALAMAEDDLASEIHEAEEEHSERLETTKTAMDQAEAALAQAESAHLQLLEMKTKALAQAKAALDDARKREEDVLALEKTELVKGNDLKEGGWRERRKARNRAAARMDEIGGNTQALIEDAVTLESQAAVEAEEDLATVEVKAFATETEAAAKAKAAFQRAQAPMRDVDREAVLRRRGALRAFDERLGLVRELFDAEAHWQQTRQPQDWLDAKEIYDRVEAKTSAHMEYQAQKAERIHALVQEKAEKKAAVAEQATGLLSREKRRLARRALAARRRRALGAGVELPEDNPQETPRYYPDWHHQAGQEII